MLLKGDALAEVEGMAASVSFETVAYIPLGLLVIFGAIWLYDIRKKASNGHVAVETSQ